MLLIHELVSRWSLVVSGLLVFLLSGKTRSSTVLACFLLLSFWTVDFSRIVWFLAALALWDRQSVIGAVGTVSALYLLFCESPLLGLVAMGSILLHAMLLSLQRLLPLVFVGTAVFCGSSNSRGWWLMAAWFGCSLFPRNMRLSLAVVAAAVLLLPVHLLQVSSTRERSSVVKFNNSPLSRLTLGV